MSLDELTLWSQDCLANLSVVPGSNTARTMTVTSGQKCCALLKPSDPLGCFSKMLMTLPIWRSTSYRLIWKVKGTPCKRLYFQLAPQVPRTSESGALLWRTPTGSESPGRKAPAPMGSAVRLSQQVFANGHIQRMWPTPQARDYRSADQPTSSRIQRKRVQGWSFNLNDVVMGTLNPEWVECLMGFPPGWTALAGLPSPHESNKNGSHPEPSQGEGPTEESA